MKAVADPERIVGGVFGLAPVWEPAHAVAAPFARPGDLLLANARSGFHVLLGLLKPGTVWLPSFLCPILVTVARRHTRVRFYSDGPGMTGTGADMCDGVRQGDLVVLIDYFGFPCDSELARQARRRGARVLEDASQALLSEHVGRCADFVLYSPRKFIGLADGGILSMRRFTPGDWPALESPPARWWLKALSCTLLRNHFDRTAEDLGWFPLFQQSEAESPVGPYAINELSEAMLGRDFGYREIARRRRENYRCLAELLADVAIFPNLDDATVPLGFQIRIQNRNTIRAKLFEYRIYPPIHWQIGGAVSPQFEASHASAAEIMTIPCDQRYDRRTMERVAELVRQLSADGSDRRNHDTRTPFVPECKTTNRA